MSVSDDYLTVNDAAKALRVSATTVRNWAAEGRLVSHRTAGGHRRFRASDVRRLARTVVPERPRRVLLVDDDPSIRLVIREGLASVGLDVIEAESGLFGLDALDDEVPALVLLDIMMSGIDGFQVMSYLQRFGVRVPVLAMSALGPEAEPRARELGAVGFIAKPFDLRELVSTVRAMIDQASGDGGVGNEPAAAE